MCYTGSDNHISFNVFVTNDTFGDIPLSMSTVSVWKWKGSVIGME